jgi:hypothetical protein
VWLAIKQPECVSWPFMKLSDDLNEWQPERGLAVHDGAMDAKTLDLAWSISRKGSWTRSVRIFWLHN